MEEERKEHVQSDRESQADVRSVVQEAIRDYFNGERQKAEPAHKTELEEERRRREQLERRVNELVTENERSRQLAEEAERNATIRDELRRLGVTKVDLGFRAIKDDIHRAPDGRLLARTDGGEVSLRDYLAKFAQENPELLPARIPGGSGASGMPDRSRAASIDLNSIRPGMDPAELARVRAEIARALTGTLNNG